MIRKKRVWTPEEDLMLAELAANGATAAQIGRRLKRAPSGVELRAKKLGLTLKTQTQRIGEIRTALQRPDARRG